MSSGVLPKDLLECLEVGDRSAEMLRRAMEGEDIRKIPQTQPGIWGPMAENDFMDSYLRIYKQQNGLLQSVGVGKGLYGVSTVTTNGTLQ